MPTGVIIDALAVFFGGLIGSLCTNVLSDRIKDNLTLIFGLAAIGMGLTTVVQLVNLPVVVLSLIVGTLIGLVIHFGDAVTKGLSLLEKPFKNFMTITEDNKEEYISTFMTVVVLFCASANGIYGSLDAGFSGDHTILISKAILDFFTALIFACNLGRVVALVSIPQFIIYLIIFLLAGVIYPLTDATMIADFKGCGGLIMIATGLRLMKIKDFPLVDMIPSLIIVMPLSYFWVNFIAALL